MHRSDFEHYFSVLAGEKRPILESQPQCGFWKRRFVKGGLWVAAAIWRHPETGELVCRVGADMVDPAKHWLSLARFPVAENDVRHYFEHGHWPGQATASAASVAPEASPPSQADETAAADAPAIAYYQEAKSVDELMDFLADPASCVEQVATSDGQPRPNDAGKSEFEKHKEAIDDALEGAKVWLEPDAKIADEKQANIIEAKINKLRELTSASTKMHKVEKEPHLTAGQAVDKKYNPDIKKMDTTRTALLKLQTVWLNAQAAKAEEEQTAAATSETSDSDDAGPPFEAQPIKTAGHSGRAIGLRDHTTVQVSDMQKAVKAILADSECRLDLEEIIIRLAKRMLTAGKKVPGAKLVTEKIAA